MAFAPSISASFTTQFLSPLIRERVSLDFKKPINLVLSAPCTFRSSAVILSRRQKFGSAIASAKSKKKKKKQIMSENSPRDEEDELDEDAFEVLFKLLEEDLKNDGLSLDEGDDDISDEELARLERELEEVLRDDDIDMIATNDSTDDEDDDEDDGDIEEDEDDNAEEGEDDDVERPVELKRWQLRRLATALKSGRRKTSIKNLAAELCLERSIVLELLRDPPPDLLMMSATLPDEPETKELVAKPEIVEVISEKTIADAAEPQTKEKMPLHVMHQKWSAQKRLKKVQVETLESVYRRTKRPTNAMISSIVQVTSLPRKRVVKWFEDKRADDGVPDQRSPYQRLPAAETASPP